MRTRSLGLGVVVVVATGLLPHAFGCASGTETEEDLPNLASRRALPAEVTSTTPDAPRPLPNEAGRDGATPPTIPDASVGNDASPEARDASLPPQDATVSQESGASTVAAPGDLAITEIQFDPMGTEPDGEWIEVTNRASSPRSMRGLQLRDGAGRSHTVANEVVVAPGAYVVLARSRTAARAQGIADTDIVYEYGGGSGSSSGVILANSASGSIALVAGAQELVRVPYGTFSLATQPGKSLELRAGAFATVAQPAHFCLADAPYGTLSSFGTPGRAPACP